MHLHHDAHLLARETGCDLRTAQKFLRFGVGRIKGYALRDRLTKAASKLGIGGRGAVPAKKNRAA